MTQSVIYCSGIFESWSMKEWVQKCCGVSPQGGSKENSTRLCDESGHGMVLILGVFGICLICQTRLIKKNWVFYEM